MKKKEIKKQMRELEETGDLLKRDQVLIALKKKVVDNTTFLTEQIENCAKAYCVEKEKWEQKPCDPNEKPSIDVDAHAEAKILRLAAWSAVVIEVLLSAYLFIISLNLPWPISLLVGVVIAFALTFIYKGSIGHYLIDHENPKRGYRRLKTLALVAAGLATVCLVPVIGARAIPQLASLTWVSGGVSAFILPVVSALLLTAAHVRDWSWRLFHRYSELSEELSDTQCFYEELEAKVLHPVLPAGGDLVTRSLPPLEGTEARSKFMEGGKV